MVGTLDVTVLSCAKLPEKLVQVLPLNTCNYPLLPQFVQYSISPVAGELIAFFCKKVMRGGKKPLIVLSIYITADGAKFIGFVPVF